MLELDKYNYDNPFYHNYVFSEQDLKRATIKWWQYPVLWFRPTYTQISLCGFVFYYKTTGDGRIFILKTERLKNNETQKEEM